MIWDAWILGCLPKRVVPAEEVYGTSKDSKFFAARSLGRRQECFNPFAPPADGDIWEPLKPITSWHLGVLVKPSSEGLECLGWNASFLNALQ